MKTEPLTHPTSAAMLMTLLALALFSGCLGSKPVSDNSRYFVLTPLASAPAGSPAGPAVGIARVEIPDYLRPKGIALRKNNNEIQYLDRLQWAERLDRGIQRVLQANLGSLLSATNAVPSTGRRDDVRAEVYVSVQRFETDELGQAVLEASWRVTSPGAETNLHAATSKITGQGPPFADNPDGGAAALSETLATLCREIANAIRVSTPAPATQ